MNKILEIEEVCTKNPKELWDHIKKLGPRKSVQTPMKVKTEENSYSTDIKTVLDKWKNDFSGLYNQRQTDNFDNTFLEESREQKDFLEENMSNVNEVLNRPLEFGEIEVVIAKLKKRKATGLDNIPNEVLKNNSVMIVLWKYLTACFESGLVPSLWLKLIINPIPKGSGKDPYVPLNYRGISLLCNISKVFTAILNIRITNYCNINSIFVDEQNGFRKGRSCDDHIFSLSSLIKNTLNDKESLFCAFIDLEKAFDGVERDLLYLRLLTLGIEGKIYNAIKSLYSNTLNCVRLNNYITDWFISDTGVRQGDNLSPTLFSLFINDLALELKKLNLGVRVQDEIINILMYADDMVLLAKNENDLQSMLNVMTEWCRKWRVKVSEPKTNIVHFRPKRKPRTQHEFFLSGFKVEVVTSYKYLGIIMDEHLTFNQCIETLSSSAGRALSGIISKRKFVKDLGFKTYTQLFNSGVVPILEYGSGVWGGNPAKPCQVIQNKALRYFLGVHRFAPTAAIHSETGWMNAKYRRQICIIRLWNRLISMNDDRLTKKIFHWDK